MKSLIAGIEVLKRIQHKHIVHFVESYTYLKHVGILICLVGKGNLKDYLTEALASHLPELRTFFGCVVRA
jgi:hypothetical protein